MALIHMENVGVHFLVPQLKSTGLLGALKSTSLGGRLEKRHGRAGVSALEDINLTLKDGDRLGLMGHNGAGKTTLLRVLATILPPSEGRIRVEGRVSALMSIRLGMDGYATGYDNIRGRARYMGCTEAEIDAKFDEIAEFTQLQDYLALPMTTYSSGMRVRLAFAIATAFHPDILVLDEWLSAGDETFKKKASDRMHELIENTGIVAFASHNLSMLQNICNKGLMLEHGRIKFFGPIDEAVALMSE
ncbi:ABC transporter ATP-binding protein [Parvularcula sp. LCG005]|uniref:ABC transporter ATP-binding protein n=1 Tax=Parvularcula sp. LCG005 TaxID=3078805 RepID=UPI002942D2F2|nr:ABC transporter ATP-binding protein [Parvularcula sp. LCG005]WOI53619.1 ABC transporter ATP-binding protein [Parvularcula sp. LCG005]